MNKTQVISLARQSLQKFFVEKELLNLYLTYLHNHPIYATEPAYEFEEIIASITRADSNYVENVKLIDFTDFEFKKQTVKKFRVVIEYHAALTRRVFAFKRKGYAYECVAENKVFNIAFPRLSEWRDEQLEKTEKITALVSETCLPFELVPIVMMYVRWNE